MRNVVEMTADAMRSYMRQGEQLRTRIILKARSIGQTMLTHRVYMRILLDDYLAKHGEPWRLRMRAPEHQPRTMLAKLLEALLDGCGGSCSQGRRPCDCGKGRP